MFQRSPRSPSSKWFFFSNFYFHIKRCFSVWKLLSPLGYFNQLRKAKLFCLIALVVNFSTLYQALHLGMIQFFKLQSKLMVQIFFDNLCFDSSTNITIKKSLQLGHQYVVTLIHSFLMMLIAHDHEHSRRLRNPDYQMKLHESHTFIFLILVIWPILDLVLAPTLIFLSHPKIGESFQVRSQHPHILMALRYFLLQTFFGVFS